MTDFGSQNVSRRQWLQVSSSTGGSLMLSTLAGDVAYADGGPLAARLAHHVQRAKRVIFLFMNGGPSQMDLLDYKPELNERDGQAGRNEGRELMGSPWKFAQHGKAGLWFSELLPHLAGQADKLCVIRSMQTDSSSHPQAVPLLHTGSFQFSRPSLGAWVLHGIGSENSHLPGFMTVNPTRIFGGPSNYGSAFLPTTYQATRIGWEKKSLRDAQVANAVPPAVDVIADAKLRLTQSLNRKLLERHPSGQPIQGLIDSLILSTRMQETIPHLMDLATETKETLDLYGVDHQPTDNFARQCLLARRFVEAGVRFIQLTHHGWDHHSNLAHLVDRCREVDQPVAGLLTDLHRRGLLDDTLVVWTGEFGREPEAQADHKDKAAGRDHNAKGFCLWMAGGGVRGGFSYGKTDELGFEAVENKVHLYDLHATILHLLGLDHTQLTFRYSGRDFRLTDVHGQVVHDIIT